MNRRYSTHVALGAMVIAVVLGIQALLGAETPRGSVRGTLIAAETGAAFANTDVKLYRNKDGKRYSARTDAKGRFAFPSVAVGSYILVPNTQAHEAPKGRINVQESRVVQAVFELKPTQPFLRVFSSQPVFSTREEAKLRVHGFVPANELTVRTYRVRGDLATSAWQGGLREALQIQGESSTAILEGNPALTPLASRPFPITKRDMEGLFREVVPLGRLDPGMYVVSFGALNVRAVAAVIITDLGLVLKLAPGEALVYAADISTGAPVPGARIALRSEGTDITKGVTGPDGLLRATLPKKNGEQTIDAVGQSGSSIALARTWLYSERPEGPLRVYSYTDRPVYRPGQRVFFRSLLRELKGGQYAVPAGEKASIRVVDQRDDPVYTANATATGFGSLSGAFTLNPEATPGPYTLRVQPARGGVYEATFSVAEYRKPEFQVSVETDKKRYAAGETIRATISAQYYYGAPVPNAKVDYYTTRAPKWYSEDESEWDEDLGGAAEFADEYGEGETLSYEEGRTDENGRLVISVPTKSIGAGDETEDADDQDQQYVVHASVQDASERSQEGTGSVLVTQGDFRLEVTADEFLARPGQAVGVDIRAADYDGHPVTGASGEVELTRREWADGDERVRDRSVQPFQADAQGNAHVSVTPRTDGDWRVVVSARDAGGRIIQQSTYLWVMTSEYEDFDYPYQDLQVRADKKLYREGETAEIVVNTKHAPQTALLTLENEGVPNARLVQLTGKSTVLKVPITPDMMPSVRASLCFIRDKRFLSGDTVLNVSRERRALKVEVTADKSAYLPGEPAVYSVRTLSPEGRPVPAEVSLGVVDAAVYAIEPDSTPNIVAFYYPKRVDMVRTAFSFPEVYLSGDQKAGPPMQTRRLFKDTAFWNPATVTDANGRASFRFTMPDNLTTWRATCRAASADTRVGQTTSEAVCRKPFLVRLETPRFFVRGDEALIAAVVHNLTDKSVTSDVGLDLGSSGAALKRQRRSVAAGATERFEWRLSTPAVDLWKVRAWAAAGALNDAMELTVPVIPKGRAQSDARSGDVTGAETLAFQVRQDAVPGTARLTVRMSPSLMGSMLGALDYLAEYPYGCAEQTISAFLPDVVLNDMLKRQGIAAHALQRQLPDMVQAGLSKLYSLQHEGGGWGWWRYDDTDPAMTAYVVYGLVRARQSGFNVNQTVFNTGLGSLGALAGSKTTDADTRAFGAYTLALAGQGDAAKRALATFQGMPPGDRGPLPARTRALGRDEAARRQVLSDWGRAYLALARARTGRVEDGRATLQPVWSRFVNRKFIPVESEYSWRSRAEYGAALLYAACELTPNHPNLGDLTRWIMDQRLGNHWCSTRDTAASLYALSRYMDLTRELKPDMSADVVVNGRTVAHRRFTAADILRPEQVVTVPAQDLPTGPVVVGVKKSGAGRLYYTASLEQVADMDLFAPVRNASGVAIERAYRRLENPGERSRSDGNASPAVSESRFETGDVIEVTLTVRSQAPFEYVMVEDPLPAGCEAQERGALERYEWTDWWAEQVFRDEKAGFAIRRLEPGVRRIVYRVRAQSPGTFTALPPRIFDMYNPATQGEAAAQTVTVR